MTKEKYEIEREAKNAAIDSTLKNLGLTVESVFVPFSRSRNSEEKTPSLNWKVTVKKNGREVLTTDYSAGCGHCPSYKRPVRFSNGKKDEYQTNKAIALECETGRAARHYSSYSVPDEKAPPLMPEARDILYSLTMDSDVIEYATFEDWAGGLGFDPDSRKGEATYRVCLEIALKLRAFIGEAGLAALRGVFQDY